MNRHWLVNRNSPEFLKHVSNKLAISPAFAQVLLNRGIKDPDSIKDFLSPSLTNLQHPFLLPDMKKAVERINSAVKENETVLVHGDYDADGITSTSLLVSTLRRLGLNVFYHIPNRITEGYGISAKGIEAASACGATLIITADCGISSKEEVATARSLGIDTIVTDHHEPPGELPGALAVINPHRSDSGYPFKYLAGVGVSFKLAQALLKDTAMPEDLLDLAAIGTVADSVPLLGENRILVTYGLKVVNRSSCRVGIQALKDSAGISGELRSVRLSYTLIPRINAAGRLDDASSVVELFLTEDIDKAKGIVNRLEEQNKKRQKIGEDVFKSALNMVGPGHPDSAIVLSSSEWHQGVIGIVASRLVDIFYRPVFLFSADGSTAKGSARSIPPFHLYKGITECADLLLAFGGHSQAAGLKILTDNLPAFRERINHIVKSTLSDDDMIPTLEIDAGVTLSEVNFDLIRDLNLLEPYGESNKEPLLGAKDVEIVDHKIVGNNHLKIKLRQNGRNMDTIGFSMGGLLEKIEESITVDIAFSPCINEWNGSKGLQLKLKAIRPGA
jgi:single-stranded-DNA-specific exonuclease